MNFSKHIFYDNFFYSYDYFCEIMILGNTNQYLILDSTSIGILPNQFRYPTSVVSKIIRNLTNVVPTVQHNPGPASIQNVILGHNSYAAIS